MIGILSGGHSTLKKNWNAWLDDQDNIPLLIVLENLLTTDSISKLVSFPCYVRGSRRCSLEKGEDGPFHACITLLPMQRKGCFRPSYLEFLPNYSCSTPRKASITFKYLMCHTGSRSDNCHPTEGVLWGLLSPFNHPPRLGSNLQSRNSNANIPSVESPRLAVSNCSCGPAWPYFILFVRIVLINSQVFLLIMHSFLRRRLSIWKEDDIWWSSMYLFRESCLLRATSALPFVTSWRVPRVNNFGGLLRELSKSQRGIHEEGQQLSSSGT